MNIFAVAIYFLLVVALLCCVCVRRAATGHSEWGREKLSICADEIVMTASGEPAEATQTVEDEELSADL